jgi:hypothetical protein
LLRIFFSCVPPPRLVGVVLHNFGDCLIAFAVPF